MPLSSFGANGLMLLGAPLDVEYFDSPSITSSYYTLRGKCYATRKTDEGVGNQMGHQYGGAEGS